MAVSRCLQFNQKAQTAASPVRSHETFAKTLGRCRLVFDTVALRRRFTEGPFMRLSPKKLLPFRRGGRISVETMNDDLTLLREFAATNSETAFATLVSRHINLVYSVALRQVHETHTAEDITQAVFIILARKANQLGNNVVLSGWLCRATRYACAEVLRNRQRRRQREEEAYMQSTLNEPSSAIWQDLKPLLDNAMEKLGQKDHDALVLRFFENKNFSDVGAALGAGEDAAKMRVGRALEKLRKFFSKRGINSTASTIGETISANSIQAAPLALVKTTATIAVAKGTAAGGSILALVEGGLKVMAWARAKTAIAVGTVALAATVAATVAVDQVIATPERFVKITGKGQIEQYDDSNQTQVVETADMTIWTDGKSYRISIVAKGQQYGVVSKKFGSFIVDTFKAQYGSDGTDIFAVSDEPSLPLHPTREGFGGYAYSGRFPSWDGKPSLPRVVQAAWLAYCSSDYFSGSSNHTGLDLGQSGLFSNYITNLVAYWKNSKLPQDITGWSRNWVSLAQARNWGQPRVATELKQYPGGFKAFQFTAADPVVVGNREWPREITLDTFWPKYKATNGDDVIPLAKTTFIADSITVVQGKFDPLPRVTVPDLKVRDSRFEDVVGEELIIVSHATPNGWPTRGSKAFQQVQANVERLVSRHGAEIQSDLKGDQQYQAVIPP